MSGNTAFIDAGQIYGSNPTRSNQLRTFSGGEQKYIICPKFLSYQKMCRNLHINKYCHINLIGMLRANTNLRGFLPTSNSLGIQVQGDFVAGDDRINEMPALAVMHNGTLNL